MTVPVLKLGKNYRLQIGDGAGSEVFTSILGEQTLALTTGPDTIDSSSKDDGDYKTEVFGQQAMKLDVKGVTKLPDTALGRLDAVRKTLGGVVDIQIVDTAAANVVKFAASMSVGAFSANFDNKSAVSYSFSLSLAAAPTVDSLFV